MNTDNKSHLNNIAVLGREFEQFGGMRARALAESFHEEDPVDCLGYMADKCYEILDDEIAEEGTNGDEAELDRIYGACYELRMSYGHGAWIRTTLLAYLLEVKGLSESVAVAERDRLLDASDKRFAPLWADYERRSNFRHIHYCLDRLEGISKEVETLKASIKRAAIKLAPDIRSFIEWPTETTAPELQKDAA